jgi:hypothetical protein
VVVVVDSVFVSVVPGDATLKAPEVGGDLITFRPLSALAGGLGAAGVTTSVFCSHAPRSAALAKMQINLFIVRMVFYFGIRL